MCTEGRGYSRHMWCAEGRAGVPMWRSEGRESYAVRRGEGRLMQCAEGRAGVCDVQRVESLVGVISIHSRLISTFYGTGKLLVHNVEYCKVHNCKVVARQDRERDLKLCEA